MHWEIVAEYSACVYILILLVGTTSERNRYTQPERSFYFSLIISLIAILSDIASFYLVEAGAALRSWAAVVNVLNYLLTLLMISAITDDANALLFEDRTRSKEYRGVRRAVVGLFALAVAITLINLKTGLIVPINAAEHYSVGPAAWTPCWFMTVNMIVLLVVFLRERRRVRPPFTRVALILPLLIITSMTLQALCPRMRLSGTLAAMTLTVLFIYGQQQRLYTDHLTALASREMFYRTLEEFAGRRVLFHVIIVSLRDYKSINIRYGQRVGDEFLRCVGTWLSGLERSAVTCRFSGVEFAMVVQDSRVDDYEKLIASIRDRFEEPWEEGQHSATLRAAIVDIAWPEHASTVNELISSLEYAVRLAKGSDSGGPVRFDKQLRNQVGRRGYVVSQLERALHENRYFIHFQPIYDCQRKRVVGAEALCRMMDETGGIMMPGEFIPLAEETELIRQIDRRVLMLACAFFSAHRDCGLEWLSVNISGMEYQSPQLREWLYDLLNKQGLPQGSIRLEITERMLIADMDGACDAAAQLRAHGVGLCLDDFGVGYSNLFSVIRMSLDCVKIDKSLVDHIAEDARAQSMLKTVVEGLRHLGSKVLAEGVETAEQQRLIEAMGVDYVQGYYHARPMSGEALLAYLHPSDQYGDSEMQ